MSGSYGKPWNHPQQLVSLPNQRAGRTLTKYGFGGSSGPGPNFTIIFDPSRYAYVTDIVGTATTTSGGTVVLSAPDGYRSFLLIRNNDAANQIAVSFGKPATAASSLQLIAGQTALFDMVIPQDDIYVMAIAGTAQVCIGYATFTMGP